MIPVWMVVVCSTSKAASAPTRAAVQPEDVDERYEIGTGRVGQRRRKRVQAPVAEPAVAARAGPIVRRDPDGEPQRVAEIAKPPLHLRVRPIPR